MWSKGINRNIVECKAIPCIVIFAVLYRINRNIVECKDRCKLVQVSINVRINRNIVECKDGIQNWSKSRCQVLIETLWNVKSEAAKLSLRVSRINRNIVECKETSDSRDSRRRHPY